MIGLSRSSFYYRKQGRATRLTDQELRDRIERIQEEFSSYGYRRVDEQLRKSGVVVNGKRIRRVMREHGLYPIAWKRSVKTTESRNGLKGYPNLLKNLTVDRLNQVWVADITYIAIRDGFVYLAAMLDLFSRRVVGWALSRRLDRELCLVALRMALRQRQGVAGCIHHSDRGVQYASRDYIALLEQNHLRISCAKGSHENTHMESFNKTLKYEEVHLWNYETFRDVLDRIPYFLEAVYNRKRLHSSIGYRSPEEFEAAFTQQTIADLPVLKL